MSKWTQLEPHHKYAWAWYTDLQKIAHRIDPEKLGLSALRGEVSREMDLLVELEHHGWFIESVNEGSVFVECTATVGEVLGWVLNLSSDAQGRLFDEFQLFPLDFNLDPATRSVLVRLEGGNLFADATPEDLAYKRLEAATLPWDAYPFKDSRKVLLYTQNCLREEAQRLGFTQPQAEIILSGVANRNEPDVIASASGHPTDLVLNTLVAVSHFLPKDLPFQEDLEERTRQVIDYLREAQASGRSRRMPRPGSAPPPLTRSGTVGRNAPCPCGSAKKYKKCCGLNA